MKMRPGGITLRGLIWQATHKAEKNLPALLQCHQDLEHALPFTSGSSALPTTVPSMRLQEN